MQYPHFLEENPLTGVTVAVRQLRRDEFPALKNFPPESWNFDLCGFMELHFGEPYFYPIVAVARERIVGVANGIMNGKTGWLGNIIVPPEFRKRGIGRALTTNLIDFFNGGKCETQLLIATDMGEPLYRKCGFRTTAEYLFFKGGQLSGPPADPNIRQIRPEDYAKIIRLDERITGETRKPLLEKFFPTGWVYSVSSSDEIKGFYLPGLGAGLILAADNGAGLALLHLKLCRTDSPAVVPEGNASAVRFLLENGFTQYLKAPRMALGKERDWKPNGVFGRAGGYCG
jgi:GNAT superfamily N-acetyltransferase